MTKKQILLAIAVSALVVAIIVALFVVPSDNQPISDRPVVDSGDQNTDNTNPDTPTEEDTLPPAKQDENPVTQPKSNDDVVITSVTKSTGKLTVRAIIQNTVEEGGGCSYELQDSTGAIKATASRKGIADASSTSCGTTEISTVGIASGKYNLVLNYTGFAGTTLTNFQEVTLP